MANMRKSPLTFTPSATVNRYRFVTLSGDRTVAQTSAGDDVAGVSLAYGQTTDTIAVQMITAGETFMVEASGAITQNARVYAAADGKASSTAVGRFVGTALEASTTNGDIIEVLPAIDMSALSGNNTFEVFDDFVSYTDGDEWTLTASNSGSATVGDAKGGVLSVDTSDATVEDNDESYFHSTNEVFLPVAGEDIIFEARVLLTEANTDDANIIFGISDTVGANTLQDNGAGPPASYDGAVFFKVDGGTVWQAETSNAGTQDTDTNVGAFSSGTWTVLRGEITSDTGDTTATVTWYVDGVSGGTSSITFSGLAEMHVLLGVKAGGANEETLEVDYVRVTQEISR